MSNRHNSVKNLPRSTNSPQKRSPLNRSIKILLDSSSNPRKSYTPTSVANRLLQKKASTERKIEILRQKKLENEMKEVQSKPTILNKSRKLAKKAEKKYLAEDELIKIVEVTPERPKINSLSQNRIGTYKSVGKIGNLKRDEGKKPRQKSGSAIRTVKSQKIQVEKKILLCKNQEFSPDPCNDTFNIEEELGMIEHKLGLKPKTSFDANKLSEKDPEIKSFLFAENKGVNQRLNFKHKFKIRE